MNRLNGRVKPEQAARLVVRRERGRVVVLWAGRPVATMPAWVWDAL